MTNADRIRNMSIEELAKVIDDSRSFFNCDNCSYKNRRNCKRDNCIPYIKKYLEMEVQED